VLGPLVRQRRVWRLVRLVSVRAGVRLEWNLRDVDHRGRRAGRRVPSDVRLRFLEVLDGRHVRRLERRQRLRLLV
jgi:hypothetical protein